MNILLLGIILIVHLVQSKDPPHLCVYPYPVMRILLVGVILIVHLAQIKDPPHLCDMMDYQNDIKQQYIYYRL